MCGQGGGISRLFQLTKKFFTELAPTALKDRVADEKMVLNVRDAEGFGVKWRGMCRGFAPDQGHAQFPSEFRKAVKQS